MSRTLSELMELASTRLDPDLIVEILELNSEDILDRFEDKFEEKIEKFLFLEDEDE